MEKALGQAIQYISNGLEYGYINDENDGGTILPILRAAAEALRNKGENDANS